MKKPVIIKLGGSLVTYKDKPLTPREDVIKRISGEIRDVWLSGYKKIFVIHGGGSFGHYIASKILSSKKHIDEKGFAEIAWYMNELNRIIVKSFLEKDLPAVQLSTRAFVYKRGGEVVISPEPLRSLIDREIIPVSFGDVILSDKDFEILSGDELAWRSALILGADIVFFASTVDGVYDKPPEKGGRKIIEKIKISEEMNIVLEGSRHIDVTGGMYTKIYSGIDVLKRGVKGFIFNGEVPGNIYKALTGEKIVGTVVEY
ncbi:MAG: isopentenyl phosphate kinase family protein [Desulfurococcales archaeon]|jgi:isopentenyl phosphate kinase|nr:isopentenyl phosphate kinase family protein [Desulfurococcales archaeon]